MKVEIRKIGGIAIHDRQQSQVGVVVTNGKQCHQRVCMHYKGGTIVVENLHA